MEAFYGDNAEALDDEAVLLTRIKVTEDIVAFCKLSEPNRRGRKSNETKRDANDCPTKREDSQADPLDTSHVSLDVCILCEGSSRGRSCRFKHLIP